MTNYSKKKVWHLSSNRWNSAITEYALSAARSLQNEGVETLFTPLKNSPAHQRASKYGLKVKEVQNFSGLDFFTLKNIYQEFQPDVIFAYGGKETTLCQIFVDNKKTKLIKFRGQDPKDIKPKNGLWRAIADYKISNILIPSDYIKNFVDSDKPIKKVVLGIDSKKFFRPNSIRTKPEIMVFGRLDPIKGHREFLQIYKSFLELLPESEKPILHILGKEENLSKNDIIEKAKSINLPLDQIKFTLERVIDPEVFMSEAAVGVVSSLGSEVICRVAQEFLLCGTPVFLSNIGALPEVSLNDHSVACHSFTHIDSVAENLKNFYLASISETKQIRIQRSHRALEQYSLESMGKNLLSLFIKTVDQ